MKFVFGVYVIAPVVGFTLVEPYEGAVVTVTVVETINPSLSTSFDKTLIANGVSSFVTAESLFAIGASLIGFTEITITDVSHNPFRAQEITQIVSFPIKLFAGVYVKHEVPNAGVRTPLFGGLHNEIETIGDAPKLVNVFVQIVIGVSSGVEIVDVSFTGFIVTKTVAVAHITGDPLSQT